jgi:hypothetical protein
MSIARISAVTVGFIVAIYTLSASPLAGPLTPGAKMSGADTVYGPGSTWTPPKTCSAWFNPCTTRNGASPKCAAGRANCMRTGVWRASDGRIFNVARQ